MRNYPSLLKGDKPVIVNKESLPEGKQARASRQGQVNEPLNKIKKKKKIKRTFNVITDKDKRGRII